MRTLIDELIKTFNPTTLEETKAALREIVQSIVLLGLSKGEFFRHASFYGGTALRIFYGLNRYSEDLDFTLNYVDNNFSIEPYISKIHEIGKSYGLELEITTKIKKIKTPVESAFAKINTHQTLINLKLNEEATKLLHKDEVIKVKFEIDCEPVLGFEIENKFVDIPEYFSVAVLDEPSLFAGKIHAILCRTYKKSVKGRDYYDFLFYTSKRIKPNMDYLRNKLIETGKIKKEDTFDLDKLKIMLKERFESVDFNEVKKDATRFIFNNEDLSFYSSDLFIQMLERL